jgi:hypothetical protein
LRLVLEAAPAGIPRVVRAREDPMSQVASGTPADQSVLKTKRSRLCSGETAEHVSSAEAYRLAQLQEPMNCYERGVDPPFDSNGKIMPSNEAHARIVEQYQVADKIRVRICKP